MDRIKKGVHLRPVQQTVRVKTQVETSHSAVQELRGILDSIGSAPSRKKLRGTAATSTESELERILRRRKVTTEQDASAGTLSALESKSMPVLGSSTSSAVSQKPSNTENTAGGNGQLLLSDKRLHTKVSSHSAETLGYAGDGKKSDETKNSLNLRPTRKGGLDAAKNTDNVDKRGKDVDSSHC
ncbi:hypothetical protein GDO78_021911 [Eleutherodactylus coqui]|uniref:Shootin-1 n=1 Tax=Eleutherodactylus coqui TaxID=57060 RepID=A0A8J6B8M6_ELECQ|nr:hypothetical protein GDO78_021911 [Eleutherodactylus coqui]